MFKMDKIVGNSDNLNLVGPPVSEQEIINNTLDYVIAEIEGKFVFFHEAVWALYHKRPIPDGKLVFHKDGNTYNNNIENLDLVDENKEYGDLHSAKNKIFHESMVKDEQNKEFLKEHFNDVYQVLYDE